MSGISHPNAKFISPTNDYNRSGGEGTLNVNVMSNMSQLANRTSSRIFQVASESPETSELLCSSFYRRSGSPFTFTSNIGGPLFRPRLVQLKHVIMPHIPNINRSNNQFCFQFVRRNFAVGNPIRISNPINVEFVMDLGYYTPDSFFNELAFLLTNAIINLFPGQPYDAFEDIVSVESVAVIGGYDYQKMRFTLAADISEITTSITGSITSATPLFSYWMPNDCSFITRGKNVVDFSDRDRIGPFQIIGPNPNQTVSWTAPSGPSVGYSGEGISITPPLISLPGPSFIYTRYVTISSEALSLYAYGESRVDRSGQTGADTVVGLSAGGGGGGGKIIGVLATSQYVSPSQGFGGANQISAVDSAALGIKNSQLKLNEFIDFSIVDEFGLPLDDAFPLDNNWGPTLAFIVSY